MSTALLILSPYTQYLAWREAPNEGGGDSSGRGATTLDEKAYHSSFFSDNATKAMFSNHMRAIIMRNNTITG